MPQKAEHQSGPCQYGVLGDLSQPCLMEPYRVMDVFSNWYFSRTTLTIRHMSVVSTWNAANVAETEF